MEWQQIAKVVILLFISAGIVSLITLVGTGKILNNNTNVDSEIWYVFGFTLMITIPIFFANELLIKSVPANTLYVQWGMIYLSLIMAYISIGAINMGQLGGSIGAATATGLQGAGGRLDGPKPCCGSCCP